MGRKTVTSNNNVVVVIEEFTVDQIAAEIAKRYYFTAVLKHTIKLEPKFEYDAALYMIETFGIQRMWSVVFDYDDPSELEFLKLSKEGFEEFRKGVFKKLAQDWVRFAERSGCVIYNRHGKNSLQEFEKKIENLWDENSIKLARQLFEESQNNTYNGTSKDSFELEEYINIVW